MNKKQHIIDVPDVPKIGVYAIRNKKNNKYYVGSSSNIKARMKTHRSNLERLYGSNTKMDEDLKSKDDIKNFEFLVLEVFEDYKITETELREREAFYINKYNAYDGYNVSGRTPCANGYFQKNELLTAKKIRCKKKIKSEDVAKMSHVVLLQRYSQLLTSEKQNETEKAIMKYEILKRMDK